MLQALFHAWERRLVSVTKDRGVRPFEWGLDWVPQNGHVPGTSPADVLRHWVADVMADTDSFFSPGPTDQYHFRATADSDHQLTFPSALVTPHVENNPVSSRHFRARRAGPAAPSRAAAPNGPAVLVLPQWNADPEGHVGLCRL